MMMMTYPVSMQSPPPGAACLHDVRAATTSDNADNGAGAGGDDLLGARGQLDVSDATAAALQISPKNHTSGVVVEVGGSGTTGGCHCPVGKALRQALTVRLQ